MNLIKKYSKLQDVPKHIHEAYKDNRWSVVIPDTQEFKKIAMHWNNVDWINYICMKGRFWGGKGTTIKI